MKKPKIKLHTFTNLLQGLNEFTHLLTITYFQILPCKTNALQLITTVDILKNSMTVNVILLLYYF